MLSRDDLILTFLLDTNAVSDMMRAGAQIRTWLSEIQDDDSVVTCTIVRGEILFGIARLAQGRRRTDLQEKANELFGAIPCEPIPERAGDFYSSIKLARQRSGLTLDENDLWVAATAIALDATLVSRDTDFAGIEGSSLLRLA